MASIIAAGVTLVLLCASRARNRSSKVRAARELGERSRRPRRRITLRAGRQPLEFIVLVHLRVVAIVRDLLARLPVRVALVDRGLADAVVVRLDRHLGAAHEPARSRPSRRARSTPAAASSAGWRAAPATGRASRSPRSPRWRSPTRTRARARRQPRGSRVEAASSSASTRIRNRAQIRIQTSPRTRGASRVEHPVAAARRHALHVAPALRRERVLEPEANVGQDLEVAHAPVVEHALGVADVDRLAGDVLRDSPRRWAPSRCTPAAASRYSAPARSRSRRRRPRRARAARSPSAAVSCALSITSSEGC
jgi:hypothetical protein